MRLTVLFVVLTLAARMPATSQKSTPGVGRWDLTIKTPKDTYPSWVEIGKDGSLRLVSRVSSVHPAPNPKWNGDRVTFSTKEWFDKEIGVDWQLRVQGRKLTGHQKRADGVEGEITGEPAPLLARKAPSEWLKPVQLFTGKDLSGWEFDEPAKNHWKAIEGELVNEAAGSNIRSTRKFQDFKLHLEYNCPEGGNSGVYLRGRYEIQVEYEPVGTDDEFHGMGAIYGFLAPSAKLPRKPAQWESLDVTLVGRTATVARNGVTTIDAREIPGITGGAVDSREAEPGPLYMQGDHTGGMKYRNITIQTPGK